MMENEKKRYVNDEDLARRDTVGLMMSRLQQPEN